MKIEHNDSFETAISSERLNRYRFWANANDAQAMNLYLLNCRLSEAFYTALHVFEVVLRNRIHTIANELNIGDRQIFWFDRAQFQIGFRQKEKVAKARRELSRDRKPHETHRIIAALNFGYWTSFFGPEYEDIWQQGLNRIARTHDGKGLTRKSLAAPLMQIRFLRNRIAHYEPIIHWDLIKHHDEIIRLTGYLSPAAAQWVAMHSRFPAVHPRGRISLHTD